MTPRAEGIAQGGAFDRMAASLAEVGRELHARGWALGTSGNLSCVVGRDPLLLAITGSGLDKGRLDPAQILLVDGEGTTTPVAFVYETLFPYSRRHLREFLRRARSTGEARSELDRLKAEHDQDLASELDPRGGPRPRSPATRTPRKPTSSG